MLSILLPVRIQLHLYEQTHKSQFLKMDLAYIHQYALFVSSPIQAQSDLLIPSGSAGVANSQGRRDARVIPPTEHAGTLHV
jgi:hypothetical protein